MRGRAVPQDFSEEVRASIQESEAPFPIRDNSCNPCQNFLVPEVSTKFKETNTKDLKFEDVAEQGKQVAVLVLVY